MESEKKGLTRRTFIKGSIGAGITLSSLNIVTGCSQYQAKGLPTVLFGKTGVRIPRIVLGLGSRFCNINDEDKAYEMLTYALDNGLYYWDTAHIYENKKNGVVSEERVGHIVKDRRNEIFLSTKVTSREPDEAMRQIEKSLKRLQTDHLDMLKIHSIESKEDIVEMSRKNHLIDIVQKMKAQGITRYVGFSGHGDAEAMRTMAELGNFDSMLIAMNHWGAKNNPQQRQEQAIPIALEKGLGVLLMKAVRPRESIKNMQATDLIRFALSQEGPHALVLGMDSLEVVKSNVEILRNFVPMSQVEKHRLAINLVPFFNHENLRWMKNDYCDGNWI